MSKILNVLGTLFSYAFTMAAGFGVGHLLAGRQPKNLEQGILWTLIVSGVFSLVQLGLLKAKLEEIRKEIKLRKAPGNEWD